MDLYQARVPLPTISEWLGHSNIETTRFYAKITEEMKRDALHKLSESDKSVFKCRSISYDALNALLDTVMEYFHITEAQLEEFTTNFISHLPKYMQDALSAGQMAV